MFLNSRNAKHMVLLSCVLASLAYAKKGQKRICDTAFILSSDFDLSQTVNSDGNGNIHNRSLSAWTWIPQFSPLRIPQVIFEAQCNSEYCSYPNSYVHERLNSLPIYLDMLVLKQDSQDRKCFRATFEKVVVGCTCVWPKTS